MAQQSAFIQQKSPSHTRTHTSEHSVNNTGNYIRSHPPSEASSTTLWCAAGWAEDEPQLIKKHIWDRYMLFHSMTFGVKKRRSEKKTCFPPTVKWIFDFDKIFAGVCCCSVLFSENFTACFLGFLLRGLHFFRCCSSSMLTLTQFFFYSNLQEPLELQSDTWNALPMWAGELHPRRRLRNWRPN